MKKLSLSPRFTKLTAALLSAVMLITACGINLFCSAETAPKMYIAFTGEHDSMEVYNEASVSHTVVDNISPDGKAVAYTVTSSPNQFNVNLFFDGAEFRSLTPATLKSMGCFFFWVSAPEGFRLSTPILKDGEGTGFKGAITTYNTTTGEVAEYTDSFNPSGFEGYVMIDLKTTSYNKDWGADYNRNWSDVVDSVCQNGSNNFTTALVWHAPEAEGSQIIFDSIGVTDNVADFLAYQKTRPLKTNAPSASSASGTVKAGTQIKLTSQTEGAEIYYTLDGTDPTTSNTRVKYQLDNLGNSPIVVNAIVTLRAVAVANGRYSTVSGWNYNVLDPNTPNTTLVNDGSDLGLTWHFEDQSKFTVVDGMGPSGRAYKTVGLVNSGAQILSFNFNDELKKLDKSLLSIQETFSFWVSNMDSQAQNFSLCFNAEGVGFYGTVVTYNTITGEIKEHNNVGGVDLAEFEGYVIFKLQDAKISTGWGAKNYSWQEYVTNNGVKSFLSYRANSAFYGRQILWDDFAFSISYDKLIKELEAKPLRTAPPAADKPNGTLAYGTQVFLTSATENAEIYYTLDGTDPITSKTRMLYKLIFMAAGLYDSPIRITKAWDELNIAPDEDGNYTVKAVAVAENESGEQVYSAVQTFQYSLEPIYDGEKNVVLNNGDGTGKNKIGWYDSEMVDAQNGAEYNRGDTGEIDLGMKFTVNASNKAYMIWMNLDTSGCVDSTGYNQFHNIQAITYRVEVSGLASGAVFKNGLALQREGCGIDATTYVISDDGKVRKNASGSLANGSYTVVMLIDDTTTVSGWAVATQPFRQYCKNNEIGSVGFFIAQQEYEKGYEHPVVIYDDFQAHFDSKSLLEELDIDGLLKDYDSGTNENSSMLVCNDGSGAKLNGGLTGFSAGLGLATSDRSKDERCLSVTLDGKDSYVSFGSFCTDFDAILCDGVAFWAEIPAGTGAVTLNFKLADNKEGDTEYFKYADTKWHYQIDAFGGAARVNGKITLPDGFRGWVIIPGDNFHYIDTESKFVNGAVDYDKLSEFTISIAGGSNSGKTIYLDDISIYASLEAIIKAHAKSWKTTIR